MSDRLKEFLCDYPCPSDTFTREQIIGLISEVPLGYKTQRDHEVLEKFADQLCAWFTCIETNYKPPQD